MRSLGITVYPHLNFSVERNIEYIRMAKKYGVSRVFSSFFSVPPAEIQSGDYTERFQALARLIVQEGMILQADVFPDIFTAFGASADKIDPFFRLRHQRAAHRLWL